MALHNVCSRREAGILARRGAVTVNGAAERYADAKVDPERDVVAVEGRELILRTHLYIMMNKPAGVLSAARDSRAKTVVDLLPPELQRRGLFPAGRLDKDTEGLLILTDDGDFAHRMLAPKSHVWKLYEAGLAAPVTQEDVLAFAGGLKIGELECLPAELIPLKTEENPGVMVKIREGKYHQVKRMLAFVGKNVRTLKRIRVGNLSLDPNLRPGEARLMFEEELSAVFA